MGKATKYQRHEKGQCRYDTNALRLGNGYARACYSSKVEYFEIVALDGTVHDEIAPLGMSR